MEIKQIEKFLEENNFKQTTQNSQRVVYRYTKNKLTIKVSCRFQLISVNLEGLITSINQQAEKIALTTKELAIGKFVNGVVSPGGLLNVLRTGKSNTEKYGVGNRIYPTHRTPIFEKKKLVGAVDVFQDISEIEFI